MTPAAAQAACGCKQLSTLLGWCLALLVLAKPGIVAAVALAGFAGMVLAGKGVPDAETSLCCLAALCLMAAGSALANSVLDRHSDRLMARLALRSAALARVGPVPAMLCAATLTLAALSIAWLRLNGSVVLLLTAAALGYVGCYTLYLKPRTPWAAVLGGLPGALPVLVGSAAAGSPAGTAPLLLFVIMLAWQPPHFWLLSLAHLEEYRSAGIPILAVAAGEKAARAGILASVGVLLLLSLSLWFAGPCSQQFALRAFLLGCAFLGGCLFYLDSPSNCRRAFHGSILYLLLLLLSVIADFAR